MNLRQLQSLIAFLDKGSFTAAADSVGLTHAAVSMQMRQLESELDVVLFDRSTKPPTLTSVGEKIAAVALDIQLNIGKVKTIASGKKLLGSAAIGFVPSTVSTLLPVVMNRLREMYPELRVIAKSGLSDELASMVEHEELDFAILTSPLAETPNLLVTEIAHEPLYAVGPQSQSEFSSDSALLESLPFIAFSKRTWLGGRIAARLQSRGIRVNPAMEMDSVDAIERLVTDGFGVSVVPQRLLAPPLSAALARIPFGDPVETRDLVVVQRAQSGAAGIQEAVRGIILLLPTESLA